jgi:nicotinate-nucleotide pyrophosphorylase (carboxylating)
LLARFPEGRPKIEVSGGVSLENIREIASTGPDVISVGRLTHSPESLDFALRFVGDP